MSFFSKLFRRRKKESDFEGIERDLNGGVGAYPMSAGHAAVDRVETIIELARELEDAKGEYRILTAYLNDVQILQDLPDYESKLLRNTAENIVALNKNRDAYLHKEKKISDRIYREMEREQKTMPTTIKRFAENEAYLETLERDLGYLESEKVQWEMYGEDYRDSLARERLLLRVLFSSAIAMIVLALVLQFAFGTKLLPIFLPLCAVLAIIAFFIYLRTFTEVREIKQCDANLNRAIKLLNKVRIKYVNAKNAVDYTTEKYHVRSSRELLKNWEAYQEAAREKQKFMTNSEDLGFYIKKLTELLHELKLYDESVWISRPEGLTDSRELVEVKHNLVERRQKIRQRIGYGMDKIREEKAEVEKLLQKAPEERSEIEGILKTVERILAEE